MASIKQTKKAHSSENATIAKSSPTGAKKRGRPAKKAQTTRSRNKAKNLPMPIEPVTEKRSTFVGNLFQMPTNNNQQSADSLTASSTSPTGPSNLGELSAEAERLLQSVPNVVTDSASDAPNAGPAAAEQPVNAEGDAINQIMASIAFEEDTVIDLVGEFFEWAADRFKSDHWKLSERQARMLGRPAAQLANAMWAKLRDKMPDIFARWCEETPGATAFIMACGLIVAPRVVEQVKISRQRASAPAQQRAPAPANVGENNIPMPPIDINKGRNGSSSGIKWDDPEV